MNILWITNTIFPVPSKTLGLAPPVFGGWMYGLAQQLAATHFVKLAVVSKYDGNELKLLEDEQVRYYLLPSKGLEQQKKYKTLWQLIIKDFKPDIVHIHGTEYPVGLTCIHSCPAVNYVISIQGIIGICSRYFYAGMRVSEIIRSLTFRDIIFSDSLFQKKKRFQNAGKLEKEYFKKNTHFIGRTSWDYAHLKTFNPKLIYHFCNESLRNNFYTTGKWDITKKNNYTIFLSQASYPLKGLHQVLKAMFILVKEFPNIHLRIAGKDIVNNKDLIQRLKRQGYGAYINMLIKKGELRNNVVFTGLLTEEQMIKEYKSAHIFICPSSIENSPNSVGEAQILGVPTIAAYVGGVPDMITHDLDGLLYRFEEIELLAENIRKIFRNDLLAQRLSLASIRTAENRHDRQVNLTSLIDIYSRIIAQPE